MELDLGMLWYGIIATAKQGVPDKITLSTRNWTTDTRFQSYQFRFVCFTVRPPRINEACVDYLTRDPYFPSP